MIPEEVENRIAKYFFHNYLPDEIMYELVDLLIPQCLNVEDENDLDQDGLVTEAVLILRDRLDGKSMK
ncbi:MULTISPECIES: hypothetical protein [Sporosarcina]|uniref:Uncharacterized protein n=1 Tax=Sporosarcina highlanderae TaxID=3035916 RepID=A0ABT8JQZ5_9BACL|nr:MULTISPECIES: hypothetical protein [Sporosarcina]MDN4607357.1 hypothetical protein [Sporosarcina highlanderae]